MRSDEKKLLIIVFKDLLEELHKYFLGVVQYLFSGGILNWHHEAHVFVAFVDETVFQYERFHLQ